ncbi:hypothetical protein K7G98_43305, partial [Saccharothrix sp. MB29]|nr:hypothetical protein [Saccharothrix sp. MB29]
PPPGLFDLDADLPPLDFDRFTVSTSGRDHIAPAIAADRTDPLLTHFAAELDALTGEVSALHPSDVGLQAAPEAYDLVD